MRVIVCSAEEEATIGSVAVGTVRLLSFSVEKQTRSPTPVKAGPCQSSLYRDQLVFCISKEPLMPSMTMDLVKRVNRLPKPTTASLAMQPLFEAISNAIHSTQSRFGDDVVNSGKIIVTVTTGRKQAHVTAAIEDNGTGLDKSNYEAFITTDTPNKIKIGGKGVGRLMWLDCFENIHVESNFYDGEVLKQRSFDFRLSKSDQIQNLSVAPASSLSRNSGVVIKFDGLRDNGYKQKFPGRPSYIFQHITSHFLPTFIGRRSPQITVHCMEESKEFPEAINELIHRQENAADVETLKYGELSMTLMECDKIVSSDLVGTHFVHFIAHDRTVLSQRIDGKLGIGTFGEDGRRVFHACLFGKFLDDNVNQERTNFTFEDNIVEAIINDVCMPKIEPFLIEPLTALKSEQGQIVGSIIQTYPSVAFGDVQELQRYVPLGELSDDAIYGHLSRQRFRRDQKQTEKIRDILTKLRGGSISKERFADTIADASAAMEDAEQKSLAEYVVRRKVILDFLGVLIEKTRDDVKDSSYQREDVLHTFICPMKINAISGDERRVVPAASHDLWVIDERLTFPQYFSSDVPFSELSAEYDSTDRPDLMVFDKVHGLRQSSEASKVLLVEFKRPGRITYKDDENPHLQVERYIKQLLTGQLDDVRGRRIKLDKDTVFFCFIIADCVGRMEDWTYSWSRTADGRGKIYQPRDGWNGSIELIEWDTLIEDARDRNHAFFDRAGINGPNFFP